VLFSSFFYLKLAFNRRRDKIGSTKFFRIVKARRCARLTHRVPVEHLKEKMTKNHISKKLKTSKPSQRITKNQSMDLK